MNGRKPEKPVVQYRETRAAYRITLGLVVYRQSLK